VVLPVAIVDSGSVVVGIGVCDGSMGETGKCVVVVVVTVAPCALASAARAVTARTTLKSIIFFS